MCPRPRAFACVLVNMPYPPESVSGQPSENTECGRACPMAYISESLRYCNILLNHVLEVKRFYMFFKFNVKRNINYRVDLFFFLSLDHQQYLLMSIYGSGAVFIGCRYFEYSNNILEFIIYWRKVNKNHSSYNYVYLILAGEQVCLPLQSTLVSWTHKLWLPYFLLSFPNS